MTPEQALAIVDEVTFPSARGGRKISQALSVSVLRKLTPDDIPALEAPPPVAAPGQRLIALRHTHHQLAQLIATGVPLQQASLITGYSGTYISILQSDPAFQEILAHYAKEETIFIDVAERMKSLGLDTLAEIQARLNDPEAKWANRELMELAELMLVKGRSGVGAGPGGQPGQQRPTVQINFVKAAPAEPRVVGDESIVIEEPNL